MTVRSWTLIENKRTVCFPAIADVHSFGDVLVTSYRDPLTVRLICAVIAAWLVAALLQRANLVDRVPLWTTGLGLAVGLSIGAWLSLRICRNSAEKLGGRSAGLRDKRRAKYEQETARLIASYPAIALHFQTVAAANGYWRN